MSIESKRENLKKNISAIEDKIKKLNLQKEIYELTLDKLEEKNQEQQSED